MPDTIRGKLIRGEYQKVQRLLVIFPTKKGTSPPTTFDPEQLHPDLRNTQAETEVDLELQGGKPMRIRPVGAAWEVAPAPPPRPAAPPPRQGTAQGARPAPTPTLPPEFHNPYNFVPLVSRDKLPEGSPFRDADPAKSGGHSRFIAEHYSGTIRVTLTTVTPMLLPDAARVVEQGEHKIYPVRVDHEGKPYLAPTSIKGALRSAYEAITNSRMAVFQGWDRRLAYRRQAKVEVEPALVVACDDGHVELAVLDELWQNSPAKLPRYEPRGRPNDKGEQRAALRYSNGDLPKHGDHVWVIVEGNGRVSQIRPHTPQPPGAQWQEGWVMITNANMMNKKSERVFVVSHRDERLRFTGNDADRVRLLWRDLIRDYQTIHEKDLQQRETKKQRPTDYLGNEPGKTAWSRHVYTRDEENLKAGMLLYVRRERGVIVGLYPVSISRDLFSKQPLELLPEKHRPATKFEELSPADRVFGWASQKGDGAWRGQVRIGAVTCETPDAIHEFKNAPLPLAILGQPKPQQGRFYTGDANGRALPTGTPKDGTYTGNQQLRGRKVYPHHSGLPDDYWSNPANLQTASTKHSREYVRPEAVRDSQNRSVQGWVKPNTTFTFTIHVTNLAAVELGALLWLLQMDDNHYHRVGGGKPLGFGSVRLTAADADIDIRTGAGWRDYYASFDEGAASPFNSTELLVEFESEVAKAFGQPFAQLPFIRAFVQACRGFSDGLPTHYPRDRQDGQAGIVPPNPLGESFEWFVANDSGPRMALPDLADDRGLPCLPRRSRGRR